MNYYKQSWVVDKPLSMKLSSLGYQVVCLFFCCLKKWTYIYLKKFYNSAVSLDLVCTASEQPFNVINLSKYYKLIFIGENFILYWTSRKLAQDDFNSKGKIYFSIKRTFSFIFIQSSCLKEVNIALKCPQPSSTLKYMCKIRNLKYLIMCLNFSWWKLFGWNWFNAEDTFRRDVMSWQQSFIAFTSVYTLSSC